MKTFIHKSISILPSPIERIVQPTFFSIMDAIRNWKLAAEVVAGKVSGTHLNGSMIFFGEPGQYRSWIAKILEHHNKSSELGQFRFVDIARFKHGLLKYDLAICPVNPVTEVLYSHQGWRIVPRFIDWVIDLRKPLNEIFRTKNIKKEISRLRKFNYTFRVMKSKSALREFYDEMLVPTVEKRHKELAYISRFEDLEEKLKNGFLLCAYRENNWIGTSLIVRESNKTARAANWGWRNGDIRLMKDHVTGALTFESINRMKTEGFEYLNMGNSLPFLDDGVFLFKHHWGFKPVMQGVDLESGKVRRTGGFLAVYFNLASKSGQAMLHQNPVMEKHSNTLRAMAWDSRPRPNLRRLFDAGIPWIDLKKTGR